MPVVDQEFQDPSSWASISAGVGVIRDGASLRFWHQPRKGKGQGWRCTLEEWQTGSSASVQEVRRALDGGAWCCAGLPPSVGLVYELHSPFEDVAKSHEIWPSLLDATLPFPLEECSVAFLSPKRSSEGGLDCLAVAARIQDLRSVLEEWNALGLHPDVLLPETLLLHSAIPSAVWKGMTRTVITAGTPSAFYAATGCSSLERREKTISRFQMVWQKQDPELSWEPCGPDSDGDAEMLERQAAGFLVGKGPAGGNLLSGDLLSERMKSGHRRLWKNLGLATILLVGLLVASPFWVRGVLRKEQGAVRKEISREYQALTGTVSTAPGQEVLLAKRYIEDQLGDLLEAQKNVSGSHLTERLLRVFFTLATLETPLLSIEADTNELTAVVLADDPQIQETKRELEKFGDKVQVTSTEAGVWRVEVIGQ